eukprot:1161333-Pelagomonas_calceolata.AAC.6
MALICSSSTSRRAQAKTSTLWPFIAQDRHLLLGRQLECMCSCLHTCCLQDSCKQTASAWSSMNCCHDMGCTIARTFRSWEAVGLPVGWAGNQIQT